jgi:hypothetical protein
VIDFIGKDTNSDCGGWSEMRGVGALITREEPPRSDLMVALVHAALTLRRWIREPARAVHFIRKRPNAIRRFRQTHFNGE